jgi:hypothetical protein
MVRPNASLSVALLVTAAIGLGLFVDWTAGAAVVTPSIEATAGARDLPGDTSDPIPTSALQAEPVVEGLPPAIARVLAEAGHLERLSAGDVGLPPAVARVLAAHGVVLRVSEPALTQTSPNPDLGRGSLSEGVTSQ